MPTEAPRFRGWRAEIRRLLMGGLPEFVTSRRPDPGEIGLPVFTYHTIEPKEFEADLRFLSANGYQTVDSDTFLDILTGRRPSRGREVLLTIDDGRASAWVWARSLLAEYDHRAVVFAIPGAMPDRAPDLGATGAGDRDPELMSWDELAAGEDEGVFDAQSHTYLHRQVPVGEEVEDFIHPRLDSPFYAVPLPLHLEARSAASLRSLAGLPILRSKPLLGCSDVYQEVDEVWQAGLDLAGREPDGSFFRRSGWRRELLAAVRKARRSAPSSGRFLTRAEVRDAILIELVTAREELEERLGGKRVRHLCLPFGAGSPRAVALAKEAGYRSVFWTTRGERRSNRVGDDPFAVVRLKHDYLRRLPGKGRRPLGRILAHKVRRRLRGGAVY